MPPLSIDRLVNTGTFPVLPVVRVASAADMGWAHRLSNRLGKGRSRLVVRGRESRPHGEGRQRDRKGGTAIAEDTGVDTPVTWPVAEYAELRVRKMQVKLHRWAVAEHGFRFDDVFNIDDLAAVRSAHVEVTRNLERGRDPYSTAPPSVGPAGASSCSGQGLRCRPRPIIGFGPGACSSIRPSPSMPCSRRCAAA